MHGKSAISIPFISENLEIEYEDIHYLDINKVVVDTVKATHAITFMNSDQSLVKAPVSIFMKNVEHDVTKDVDKDKLINSKSFLVQGTLEFTEKQEPVTIDITTTGDVVGILNIESGETKKTKLGNARGDDDNAMFESFTEKDLCFTIHNKNAEHIRCIVKFKIQGKMHSSDPKYSCKTEEPINQRSTIFDNPSTSFSWDISVPALDCSILKIKYIERTVTNKNKGYW